VWDEPCTLRSVDRTVACRAATENSFDSIPADIPWCVSTGISPLDQLTIHACCIDAVNQHALNVRFE